VDDIGDGGWTTGNLWWREVGGMGWTYIYEITCCMFMGGVLRVNISHS